MDICISGSEYVSCAHSLALILCLFCCILALFLFYLLIFICHLIIFLDTFCILMRKRKRFGWVGGKKRSLEELGGENHNQNMLYEEVFFKR